MFVSKSSELFLKENGFQIIQNNDGLTIAHNKSINFLWPVISIILGISLISLLALANFKLAILVVILVVFPASKTVQGLTEPKFIELNTKQKLVLIKNKMGRTYYHRFGHMAGIRLSTLDQTLEPNAFQDEVVVRNYFIELSFEDGSTKTILSFKEVEKQRIEILLTELEKIVSKPQVA